MINIASESFTKHFYESINAEPQKYTYPIVAKATLSTSTFLIALVETIARGIFAIISAPVYAAAALAIQYKLTDNTQITDFLGHNISALREIFVFPFTHFTSTSLISTFDAVLSAGEALKTAIKAGSDSEISAFTVLTKARDQLILTFTHLALALPLIPNLGLAIQAGLKGISSLKAESELNEDLDISKYINSAIRTVEDETTLKNSSPESKALGATLAAILFKIHKGLNIEETPGQPQDLISTVALHLKNAIALETDANGVIDATLGVIAAMCEKLKADNVPALVKDLRAINNMIEYIDAFLGQLKIFAQSIQADAYPEQVIPA